MSINWSRIVALVLLELLKSQVSAEEGSALATGLIEAKTLNSVASLPSECLSSGVALNLKFTPKDDNEKEMLKNFVAYVESYFGDDEETGGMEIQFNVTSHDTFIDAVNHPEDYPELLVRVSGYTAYFKDLNPQMQKEIIDRTEYLLSTGKAVPYEPFKLR